ncbi:DevR family CRISPR-associated autoregulator [Runella sp. MFBS21]|uniref:DevR family CRISPR-associated autoregulator n=1 Tax=Runella sp. MFBS21 TaxID=3034018 RepID=UPI0023F84E01|nr:DevR family CRISPR-associated autoregulator [Runella sp. MFBS21]MDF7816785.1 DevR family CRISPR-associated autoregulator [Runella sp. MFBS21]
MTIKSITVTLVAPMSDHAANRGERLLGNLSSIKQRPDERVYIAGQMQRHALFSAIDRLNENKGGTYLSNGDGINFNNMKQDLRADMGGFLRPGIERRTSPISATPAVAKNPSQVGRDLLLRLNQREGSDPVPATNSYSQYDEMVMSFHLDLNALGVRKQFVYNPNDETHIKTHIQAHIDPSEQKRRVKLFLEGTRYLTDYANQARNATSGEPQKVLIVLDTVMSRKAARYYKDTTTDIERENILAELDARKALYFLGDDTKVTNSQNDTVDGAYRKALAVLNSAENQLYWPGNQPTPAS